MHDGPRAWATLLAAATFALAAGPACVHAQGVYKIVGPDGRVTYADQPPSSVGPNGRIDVLRAPKGPALVPPVPAPVASVPVDPGSANDTASRLGRPKAATTSEPRRAAQASADATVTPGAPPAAPSVDSAVEAAVIGVLDIEDVVRRTESICVSTLPTSARRYSGAVDEWARRNARTVMVARRVLSREFDVEKRELIEAGIARRNAGQFEKIVESPPAARIAWCDRSTAEIAGGRMDVHDKPKLAGPLAELPTR
ncbi:MAG: hypothetical protein ACK50I_17040 [Burkholderiales bacterium]